MPNECYSKVGIPKPTRDVIVDMINNGKWGTVTIEFAKGKIVGTNREEKIKISPK